MDGRLQYSIEADAASLNNAVKGALAGLGQLSSGIAATAAKYGLLASAAGAVAVAAGGAAGLGIGVKIAAQREQVKIAFKNIIGDAKEADRVLAELFDFANVTPFESDEIILAARKLLAAGVATTDLKTELTALGNVAAGVGTDIGGLATIYSQISDKGKVMAEELMQFGERGAGAIRDQLAKSLGVTKAQLVEMTSTGQVSFAQFRTALMQLAGATGKWGNLMAEQSTSTIGLWSTLKDAITTAMNELGQPLNDAIKPILSGAIGLAGELKPVMADIGTHVAAAVTAMRDFVAEAGKGGSVVSNLMTALSEAFGNVWSYLAPIADGMGTIALGFGAALFTALTPFAKHLMTTFEIAGLRLKAILLDTLSNIPGLGHLAGQAKTADSKAQGLSDNQPTTFARDVKAANTEAANIMAMMIKKAGDDVRKSWDAASNAAEQRKVEAEMKRLDAIPAPIDPLAEMRAKWAAEDAAKPAPEDRSGAVGGDGYEARKARMMEDKKRAAREYETQQAIIRAQAQTPKAGEFGSGTEVPEKPTQEINELGDSADDAAQKNNDAAEALKKLVDARVAEAMKEVKIAGNAAAGALGNVAHNAQAASAKGSDDSGAPSGRIKGGSQQRLASGENARSQWGRLNEKEKAKHGNDPGRWMNESAQGGAAWRSMQTARASLQRQGKWHPLQYQGAVQQRANQAVGGGASHAPPRGQGQGNGAPAAQTQDSSQRVLLQNILTELRRMGQHLGSLTKG